jgi:hypothetical protein
MNAAKGPTWESLSGHGLPEGDQVGEAVEDRQFQLIHRRIRKPVGDRLRLRRQVSPVAVDVHRHLLAGQMEHGAVAEPYAESVHQLPRPVEAGAPDRTLPDRA